MSSSSLPLRSQQWWDNPANPDMTALYLERYLNFGLTRAELQSGRPIIGIAQTGSDLVPCNRHHLQLADRVRAGVRDAGGIALEFPVHPLQETGKRPTAALDRNLAYLGLVALMLFAIAWISTGIGLATGNATGAASLAGLFQLLPFLSGAFVPTETMPGWLQAFAANQPMTHIVTALRGLLTGRPVGQHGWLAIAWCAGLTVVGFVGAVAAYNRRPGR